MKSSDRDALVHEAARERLADSQDIGELEENWKEAYGYYNGELPGPVEAFTSTVTSSDVADTVEWLLPAVLKPLVESPDVVRFDGVSPEDQAQADLESDYVHHTFMKRCDGFLKLYCHIKDALLLRYGVFCTYWDESLTSRKESYRQLTEYELGELLSPADGSEVVPIETRSYQVPVPDVQTQAPGQMPITLYDVTVRRINRQGRPVVENGRPEDFRVISGHGSINLDGARFAAYRLVKTRSELKALGYDADLIDEMPKSEESSNTIATARQGEQVVHRVQDNSTEDPSQDLFDIQRCYMSLDTDGDGIAEDLVVILGGMKGDVLLDWYEVPHNPFSASTPFITPHAFVGRSVFDKVRELADHKSKVLRMLEDNLDNANNPKKKVTTGAANLDDLFSTKVGGVYRVDDPTALDLFPTPLINQQAQQLLDYYDKQRGERTGLDPNAQAIISKLPEESMNTAVERVLTMKEELVGLIIRVFAETGVKSMFCKLRTLLMMHMNKAETVQLRNKWVEVNPGNWTERMNTTVKVGLGTGDRYRKQNALMQIMQVQQQAAAGGLMGVMVSPERMAHTVSELVRTMGLGDPDDFVLDPALLSQEDPMQGLSPRAQEAARAQALVQQQAQQAQQAEQAKAQAAAQAQAQVLQAQMQIEQMRAEARLQEAQIQAQSKQEAILAQMEQFQEENRRMWAELAAKISTDDAKIAANTATMLIQQGAQMQQSEMAMAKKDEPEDDE